MTKTEMAFELGVKAFNNGRKCIPACDQELLDTFLKETKVGEGLPYIKAWIRGWTYTNLKAVL
jgi:hypothetical protein